MEEQGVLEEQGNQEKIKVKLLIDILGLSFPALPALPALPAHPALNGTCKDSSVSSIMVLNVI